MNDTKFGASQILTRNQFGAKTARKIIFTLMFVGSVGSISLQAQAGQTTSAPTPNPQHTNQRKANRSDAVSPTTPSEPTSNEIGASSAASGVRFAYEFKQPQFLIPNIRIEHDAAGRGRMTFTKRNVETPFTESVTLSPTALTRISDLWAKLDRLKGKPDLQAPKQFPHLGTMILNVTEGGETRAAEFNWTQNPDALALITEYRRLSDQTLFIFDITVARENQPLEAPSIMKRLEILVRRKDISDGKQLLPFLRELATDERLPLIARNQAGSLAKKLEKN